MRASALHADRLEARGFYNHLLHKSPVECLRELVSTLVWMGTIVGAIVVFSDGKCLAAP